MSKVYTTEEAAKLCYVSGHTIRRALDAGTLRGFRINPNGDPDETGKHRRIRRPDLIEWMTVNGIPLDKLGALTEEECGIVVTNRPQAEGAT